MLDLHERLGGRADGALRRMLWPRIVAFLGLSAALLTAGGYAIRSLVGDAIGLG